MPGSPGNIRKQEARSSNKLLLDAACLAAVISGHSHVPANEMRNGVLYFNPGSAGPRRFKLRVSVGRLWVSAKGLRVEIVDLKSAS